MKNITGISSQVIMHLFALPALMCFSFTPVGTSTTTLPNPEPPGSKQIRVALLLDTSNSMDGLIDQAKSTLWSLVQELSKARIDNTEPEVLLALYEYGNSRLSPNEGYIRQLSPLSSDLDKISEELFGLKTQGGEEFCGQVIMTAANDLDWKQDAEDYQVIFIAGNEPFTQGRVNYLEACAKAKHKGITINTIHCGSYQEGINGKWKDGAECSGGNYMHIDQDRKITFYASPYDDRISELNTSLNKTYIIYGGAEARSKQANQVMQDKNAASYGKEYEVKRAVSKGSHVYKNDSWDLVDASKKSDFDISKVKEQDLPANMQSMSKEQRIRYIESQKIERQKIQNEIGELNKKREAYVALEKAKRNDNENTLESAMIKAVRKQAELKGFRFNQN